MAETPPPFQMGQPKRSSGPNVALIVGIVAVVMISCCGLLGFGVFQMFQGGVRMASSVINCTMNFALAQSSVRAYAEANGGKLPAAATWQSDVKPYYDRLLAKQKEQFDKLKDNPMFNFTFGNMDQPLPCSFGEPTTYVTFNSDLSGKLMKDVQAGAIVLFEGSSATLNANTPYKARPKAESPKIMGSARDWIAFPIEGDPKMFDSSTSSADFNIDWKDALPAPPSTPPAPTSAPAP